MIPKNLGGGLIKSTEKITGPKKKKKWVNPSKIYSSKSLILNDLHKGPRYLGD